MKNLQNNVFIFQYTDKENNCLYNITEAFSTNYGFSHSEVLILEGFTCKIDAVIYCQEFNLKILNN